MDRIAGVGLALSALGALGYVAGVLYAYPGRAFTITAVMVGITLCAISEGRLVGGGE
ncbi:hypothetical protein [Halarchaeum nitratireducens]|uniref:Uncharacterized protein n=1 Tax=Halarchaeum nitratireducens TaxID=489913 RepID=A0A830GCX0_9EURY|nr:MULTISPECIES: hypothetical protein [Halarchaeum]MBP2250902.1 hypothetical protein [Halarchaeum solikamskense]GGN19778.1 hypothetical protein GCM10009021_21100 [Halarchaeum nitratireducens]